MINGRRVLAVVPARGGSKGIHLKNLRCINGKSLVTMAGEIAQEIDEIDRRIVSTDHADIARVAASSGLDCPFMRPKEISGDRVSDWEVLNDVLQKIEKIDNCKYDIILMLQPTSPLRKAEDVREAITMLIEKNMDSIWSVSETDSKAHPLKQLLVNKGQMQYWDLRGAEVIARQELESVYHRNGAVYVMTRDCIINQKTIQGARSGAYITKGNQISIDTEWDLKLASLILNNEI